MCVNGVSATILMPSTQSGKFSTIKPRAYVRRIMYEKNSILLAGTGVRKNSTVASVGPVLLKPIILITPNQTSILNHQLPQT